MLIEKRRPLRDRKYLDALRDEPCIISGRRGTDYDAVDPAHIGTRGKSQKSGDDEALPILHSIHAHEMHQHGEISVLRRRLPDDVLREALRAYARERYRRWKDG